MNHETKLFQHQTPWMETSSSWKLQADQSIHEFSIMSFTIKKYSLLQIPT